MKYRVYHVPTNTTIALVVDEQWARLISEAYYLAYEEAA